MKEEKLALSLLKELHRRPGLLLGLFAFTVYLLTLAPSYLWSDSAKLAIYVYERNFVGVGYEFHPLHTLLGYVFSLLPLPLAYSQNVMSAFFAAGTLYFLFIMLRTETGDPVAAALACSALAVSQLFWLYAVINETYSLVTFFLVLILFLSLKWAREKRAYLLYLIAFLFGMGFANHAMTALFLPGTVLLLWDKKLPRLNLRLFFKMTLAVISFLMGASPVFLLPLFEGMTLSALLSELMETTHGHYGTFMQGFSKLIREILRYPLYLLYQFPTIGVWIGGYGFIGSVRDKFRLILSTFTIWLAVLLFACQYFLQRQFAMLIPSFVIFSIWIGLGISLLGQRYPARRTLRTVGILFVLLCMLPPWIYYGTYRLAETIQLDLSFVRKLPYRNTYRYYLFPPKNLETGAEEYVEDSFKQAREGAIVLTDFNPGAALLYGQKVLGRRKDLRILVMVDDWVHHGGNSPQGILGFLRTKVGEKDRPIYLSDNWEEYYHASVLEKEFILKQEGGPLWEVLKKEDGQDPSMKE